VYQHNSKLAEVGHYFCTFTSQNQMVSYTCT